MSDVFLNGEVGNKAIKFLMVISLAFVVRWIINNQRERRRLIEMTDSVIKERISKQKKEKIKEIVEHSVINTENTIENNDNSAEEEIDEKLEEEYIEDSKSDDFESRLKRLTGE